MRTDSSYGLPKGRQQIEIITSVQRRMRKAPAEVSEKFHLSTSWAWTFYVSGPDCVTTSGASLPG
jgi:hypothetical protein